MEMKILASVKIIDIRPKIGRKTKSSVEVIVLAKRMKNRCVPLD